MEQTLGHVTHAQNFRQWINNDPDVIPTWIPVSYDIQDRWDKVPLVKRNWTLRASLRAREQVRAALRSTTTRRALLSYPGDRDLCAPPDGRHSHRGVDGRHAV